MWYGRYNNSDEWIELKDGPFRRGLNGSIDRDAYIVKEYFKKNHNLSEIKNSNDESITRNEVTFNSDFRIPLTSAVRGKQLNVLGANNVASYLGDARYEGDSGVTKLVFSKNDNRRKIGGRKSKRQRKSKKTRQRKSRRQQRTKRHRRK